MMKITALLAIALSCVIVLGDELKVVSNFFDGDDKKGIAIFTGDVKMKKGSDELNATKVTIYTDKKHDPIKMVAEGDVSLFVKSENKSVYDGKAQKVVYMPKEKEYQFYTNVHLRQLDERKQIDGDKVILNTITGRAVAQGAQKAPVVMIFHIKDKNETK
jgi:lipopolysaccharide export system protein LptA